MANESSVYNVDANIEWEKIDDKLQRKIFGYNESIMMVKVHFKVGGVGPLHAHPHSQTTYVESGSFEVTIGNEKKVLRAGDGFYIPSNVEHGAICLEEGLLIDVFSPVREDFLEGISGYSK